MNITIESEVGAVAATVPGALRVLDIAGIDYCCAGGRSLAEACSKAGIDAQSLLARLIEAAAEPPPDGERDFTNEPLTVLIDHVVATHHIFTRDELERGSRLFERVAKVHGERRPELLEMKAVFDGLRDELIPHLMKEERILFPYICALEQSAERGGRAVRAPFGTVENPVRMMNYEHETAGAALESLRALSNGYTLPEDACTSFRSLYDSLASLDRDLRRHIHLESNVMFPRAIELEGMIDG